MTFFPPAGVRRTALAGLLCAGLTVVLGGCAEDPDKGTNGVGKLSADKIESRALDAARKADAVRLKAEFVSKGATYSLDMQLTENGGKGQVTSKGSSFKLLRIGEELYMQADAALLAHEDDDGKGAADPELTEQAVRKLHGKYVKVPSDDSTYQQMHDFTSKDVLLDWTLSLDGKTAKGDRKKVNGVRVIEITGDAGNGGTLSVSLEGTPYPLRLERAGNAGTVELTEWGKGFALEKPGKDEVVDYGSQLPDTNEK
ncbi:hypothetical protein [Streptomyces sp. GC420]|uniref:hypothetical protein n=1 Tax=Streptomyces sp. GC420 TaxID=2697568 RepID=UPI001414E76A|nr:hypothetical protein [Streptomyces sp. GC420]NBM16833.1 hypothetical protein [Streptomyces sp. GC420]